MDRTPHIAHAALVAKQAQLFVRVVCAGQEHVLQQQQQQQQQLFCFCYWR